jgi:hypothetical protein
MNPLGSVNDTSVAWGLKIVVTGTRREKGLEKGLARRGANIRLGLGKESEAQAEVTVKRASGSTVAVLALVAIHKIMTPGPVSDWL